MQWLYAQPPKYKHVTDERQCDPDGRCQQQSDWPKNRHDTVTSLKIIEVFETNAKDDPQRAEDKRIEKYLLTARQHNRAYCRKQRPDDDADAEGEGEDLQEDQWVDRLVSGLFDGWVV